MKLRLDFLAVLLVVFGSCAVGVAQIPFEPANDSPQPAPAQRETPQQQADVEWLMSYMLAHEGYRFDDVPRMERSFGKMSPTQLHTLREFYEKKLALQTQHAATMAQAQQVQVQSQQNQSWQIQSQRDQASDAAADATWQRQDRRAAFFLTPEQDAWQGSIANVRLQNMREIAEANEKGYLFQVRQLPGLRKDPFGPTPMRGVGYGSWGERRNDLSPNAGAN